ncbi:hypothetical protein [Rhodococcus jostii]|uniref:ABM domain-containing protein n=1 Tax=Rhodococcus jostii TaxID=132919 RepID=A0A1H4TQ17_RHOJO|nr:hypothetical protein [Rhodococcus jostii]SEC58328.1 hypothetical protein SAMN04490220_2020 [Rhodococcus jostii]
MFIQVIQGKVSDEARLRQCMDRWTAELRPGAIGYLGSTHGLCDDGTFIALVRFESTEDAQRNSQRPEQDQWWAETQTCFEGAVSFMDCPDVTSWMGGGSDAAGFVQVMEGHSAHPTRMRQLMEQASDQVRRLRPDILGGTFARYGDDGFVEALYFTSESEARGHEKAQVPDDLRALFKEENLLMGKVSYYDMHEPVLVPAER